MGKYEFWVKDRIIYGKLSGIHDREEAETVIKEFLALIEKENIRKVLIDMGKIEKATLEARRVHLDNFISNPDIFDKLALYGADTMNRVMVNFLIKAVKLEDKIKYFNSEADALEWLKE